jgi:hypothetical protein
MICKLLAANVSRAKVMAIKSFRAPERHQELRDAKEVVTRLCSWRARRTGFVEPKKAVVITAFFGLKESPK